jgi:HSP20 family molecular chaperone IbpA
MWAQAFDLIEQAERMHRQFFRPGIAAHEHVSWEPPVDVFEDEREVVILVALPGVLADGVEVEIHPGALTVRAERPLPIGRHSIRQLEIPYGTFERRIPLPEAPLEIQSHELTHGCLILRLRKTS